MRKCQFVSTEATSANILSAAIKEIDLHIQDRIRSCPYGFNFNRVTWLYSGGTLTLRGRVSTFYLKQILQTILRDVGHVQLLVNEVDVVCVTGLESSLWRFATHWGVKMENSLANCTEEWSIIEVTTHLEILNSASGSHLTEFTG